MTTGDLDIVSIAGGEWLSELLPELRKEGNRMNLTDELRSLLDEHGIEWWHDPDVSPDHTEWMTDHMAFTSLGVDDDFLAVETISKMTPDQAIYATIRPQIIKDTSEQIKRLENLIRAMYLDLLAEMPESLLENRRIQIRELGIEV